MNPERKKEKLSSLKSFFESETKGQSGLDRAAWLFSHLEEYLERWCGWVTYCEPVSGVIETDLHLVLGSAVEIMLEEQARLVDCDRFQEKWKRFALIFRQIDKHTGNEIIEDLRSACEDARKELVTCLGQELPTC